MSWISIDDEVGAIVHLLGEGAPAGPVNATAPNPVTNADFSKALGQALKRPAVMPVPAPALRLLLGREMADELILGSMRVLPTRLLDAGYAFSAPDVGPALQRMLASG
jgi:NAD dependent epimerase/dehydratase family enzyme